MIRRLGFKPVWVLSVVVLSAYGVEVYNNIPADVFWGWAFAIGATVIVMALIIAALGVPLKRNKK